MTSIQAVITKKVLRIQPYGWAKGSIEEQRARQEKSARFSRIPKKVHCQPVNLNGITAEWISCSTSRDGVVLYLHGGAYALGSVNIHREYRSRLALATRLKVLAINYRLAPEHPFPAALEDSISAYRWLRAQDFDSSRIVIAGDSAGGGLALSTLVTLRDAGEPLPARVVCISPWLDLSLSGDSIREKASADPILHLSVLERYASYYAGTHDRKSPLISPLFADLTGLPPLLVQVGSDEILLDDSVRLTHIARQSGVDITLKIWDGLFHVFQIVAFFPETADAMQQVAGFLSSMDGNRH
jgi:acetyl esterase/lipase